MKRDERYYDVDVPPPYGTQRVISQGYTGRSQVRYRPSGATTLAPLEEHQRPGGQRADQRSRGLHTADVLDEQEETPGGTYAPTTRASRRVRTTQDDPALRRTQEDPLEEEEAAASSTEERCPSTDDRVGNRWMRRHLSRLSTTFWVGVGMCSLLVLLCLWYLGVSLTLQVINASLVPATTHVAVVEEGSNQYLAFVDSQQHLDALLVPQGDVTHARVIQGPLLSGLPDPGHTLVSIQTEERPTGQVTALQIHYESARLLADGLGWQRPGATWTVPTSAFGASGKGKGGH